LRASSWVNSGDLTWVELDPYAIAFERNGYLCITNFGDSEIQLPDGDLLLASDNSADTTTIAANTTVWMRRP
jgi:alpha-glucosidase